MERSPLPREVGTTSRVDAPSKLPARRNTEIDVVATTLGPHLSGQSQPFEKGPEASGKGETTSTEGGSPSLVNGAIPVKDTAEKIPQEDVRDGVGHPASTAFPRGNPVNTQFIPKATAVDTPSERFSPAPGDFDSDGSLGSNEIADEDRGLFVQADEANSPVIHGVSIGQHQPNEVGQLGSPVAQSLKEDRVSTIAASEPPVTPAAHRAEVVLGYVPLPSGSAQGDSTAGTQNLSDGTSAVDRAMFTEPNTRGAYMEVNPTSGAYKQRHKDILCVKCGAIQCSLGLEPSIALYLEHLVTIFREVRRVLRHDGTCWLNLGDGFAGSGRGPTGPGGLGDAEKRQGFTGDPTRRAGRGIRSGTGYELQDRGAVTGLKPKDLMMLPARVALALQADGWWVRSDIAWCKKSSMPESVSDRPTNAWEHIFLLAGSELYFYDGEAVRESYQPSSIERAQYSTADIRTSVVGHLREGLQKTVSKNGDPRRDDLTLNPAGRNQRNFWLLGPEAFPGEHYATFPTAIPRRAILAGTSAYGVWRGGAAPGRRSIERVGGKPNPAAGRAAVRATGGVIFGGTEMSTLGGGQASTKTTGWEPSCRCGRLDVVAATVLDPFAGAGTTVMVAKELGRNGIGIEMSPAYCEMAQRRLDGTTPALPGLVV